jgi:hypothetical protein
MLPRFAGWFELVTSLWMWRKTWTYCEHSIHEKWSLTGPNFSVLLLFYLAIRSSSHLCYSQNFYILCMFPLCDIFNLSPCCICYVELCSTATFFKRKVRKDIRNRYRQTSVFTTTLKPTLKALIFPVLTIFSLKTHSTEMYRRKPFNFSYSLHSKHLYKAHYPSYTASLHKRLQSNMQHRADPTYLVLTLFFGAFAKLRKSALSFVISVCPSVRMENLDSHWTDFH